MTLVDQNARDEIMDVEGNIVISASAGSGKTTIMIKKLKKVLEDISDHKTIAAITFTTKATAEIKKKAREEGVHEEFVAMTNDSFIEHEIIRPFITDTYGANYKSDFTIDYDYRFSDFERGKEALVEHGKLGVFQNVRENFKFRLALDILKNNIAACQYLQSKYEMLFLDEYQDSDLDMHKLFMHFKDELHINLFIVGDSKQAIYLWRGAQQNIFELLEQDDMRNYELVTNFRSHDEIVNYANLLHNSEYFNEKYSEVVNCVVHCKTSELIKGFSEMVESGEINLEKEIAIIININNDAQKCTDILNEAGYNFQFIPRTPIDNNTPNSLLLHQLACYIIDDKYSIYNLIDSINADSRKQMVNRIERTIGVLKENLEDSEETFQSIIMELGRLLEVDLTDDEVQLLYQTVQNDEFHAAFINTEDKHKVMTVFASKGLEFDQVISFSGYYNVHSGNNLQNHYVCITRAKDKFVMIDNSDLYEDFITSKSNNRGMIHSYNLFKTLDFTSK